MSKVADSRGDYFLNVMENPCRFLGITLLVGGLLAACTYFGLNSSDLSQGFLIRKT